MKLLRLNGGRGTMADRCKAVGTPRFWRIGVGWACGGAGSSILGLLGRRWFGVDDEVCRWRVTVGTACVVAEACRRAQCECRRRGESRRYPGGWRDAHPWRSCAHLHPLVWALATGPSVRGGRLSLTRSEEGVLRYCWTLAFGPSLGCRRGSGLARWMGRQKEGSWGRGDACGRLIGLRVFNSSSCGWRMGVGAS